MNFSLTPNLKSPKIGSQDPRFFHHLFSFSLLSLASAFPKVHHIPHSVSVFYISRSVNFLLLVFSSRVDIRRRWQTLIMEQECLRYADKIHVQFSIGPFSFSLRLSFFRMQLHHKFISCFYIYAGQSCFEVAYTTSLSLTRR